MIWRIMQIKGSVKLSAKTEQPPPEVAKSEYYRDI